MGGREAAQKNTNGEEAASTVVAPRGVIEYCSAMSFEQGWISLHQMLSTKPDGNVGRAGVLRGAQSVYPFARDYIYK